MDDIAFLDPGDTFTKERMQVDIDLCIQCLIMRRREAHVEAVIGILQVTYFLIPFFQEVNYGTNCVL